MKNKNIEKKFLPEGFRYLKEGEPIKHGDYFWGNKNNKWTQLSDTKDISNWINGPEEYVIRKEGTNNVKQ